MIASLPRAGEDPAEQRVAWCYVVCDEELAMIVAKRSDKNNEELVSNRLAKSDKNDKNGEALTDGPSAWVGNSTSGDKISLACTICAECGTNYEKMNEVPETNSTTMC